MPSKPRASTSVVAAGVVAVLGGALAAILNLAALTLLSFSKIPQGLAMPDFMRPVLIGIWSIFLLCAVFVAVVGIQVIRLRNWARISLLVIAGCLLFFGVIGVGVIFVTLFVAVPYSDPLVAKSLLASVLAITYGTPIAIAIWWLALFTRRSVVAQFQASALAEADSPAVSTFRLSRPGCPLGIRIIGWYLASFVLFVPFLPFCPKSFPVFFFDRALYGLPALIFLFLYFTLLIIPGFGLLLLKRWSYPLAIGSQLFASAYIIAALFSPAYTGAIRTALDRMDLPAFPPTTEQMLHYSRYFNLISLTIPLTIVITLLVVRREFFAAADADPK
jgi:hypothetical protein